MKRLTDRVRAQKLKDNADKLKAAGFAVSPDHELYIKLAEYENAEEEKQESEQCLKENAVIRPLDEARLKELYKDYKQGKDGF